VESGEGTTINEDKKPYERAGRKKVVSSTETAVAGLRSLWLAASMVVRGVLCRFRDEEELPLSRASTATMTMLLTM
jgi:hypothetical protein